MKYPYSVLGLDESASKEELENKYNELKAVYSEGRFQPGAEGMKAARNLNDLENAWRDILDELKAKEVVDTASVSVNESTEKKEYTAEFVGEDIKKDSSQSNALAYADSLIKAKKFEEAQRVLDNVTDRTAQWHYLQSRVYYNREWIAECKKHLEIAISMEPNNEKYKATLNKLNYIIGNKNANPNNLHAEEQANEQYANQNMYAGNSLLNCCSTYCLMNMCCDMCCRFY